MLTGKRLRNNTIEVRALGREHSGGLFFVFLFYNTADLPFSPDMRKTRLVFCTRVPYTSNAIFLGVTRILQVYLQCFNFMHH